MWSVLKRLRFAKTIKMHPTLLILLYFPMVKYWLSLFLAPSSMPPPFPMPLACNGVLFYYSNTTT